MPIPDKTPHPSAPVVGYDRVTGVPLCEHGDDAEACQFAHRKPAAADLTQPRPFEELVDLIGLQAAGDMLEAAAPAVREAGADIQQTGAILLTAVRGLQAAGHRRITIFRPTDQAGGGEAIAVTPEMRSAFLAENDDTCDQVGCGRADCLDARLAAALAVVVEMTLNQHPTATRPNPTEGEDHRSCIDPTCHCNRTPEGGE